MLLDRESNPGPLTYESGEFTRYNKSMNLYRLSVHAVSKISIISPLNDYFFIKLC